jgi:hypothetical protein
MNKVEEKQYRGQQHQDRRDEQREKDESQGAEIEKHS